MSESSSIDNNFTAIISNHVVTLFILFSVNSSCSSASASKYDPDLLKSEVLHAKSRVQRLRRELANIDAEVAYQQQGVDTLAKYVLFIVYFLRPGNSASFEFRLRL